MVKSIFLYGRACSIASGWECLDKYLRYPGQVQISSGILYSPGYPICRIFHKEVWERNLLSLPEIFSNIPLQSFQNRVELSLSSSIGLETARSRFWGSSLFTKAEPPCILRKIFLLEFEKLIVLSVAGYRKGKTNFPLDYFESFIENSPVRI